MDRLMALQAFARVVELGGFTKASDSLQLPKTTVSDLVQGLEKHLGVRLLQRTTRRVTVTADGAAFYERCVQILADLNEAEASVMQVRVKPKGRLRVDMPGGLARLFIIPRLADFLGRYPDLRLELGMGLRRALAVIRLHRRTCLQWCSPRKVMQIQLGGFHPIGLLVRGAWR